MGIRWKRLSNNQKVIKKQSRNVEKNIIMISELWTYFQILRQLLKWIKMLIIIIKISVLIRKKWNLIIKHNANLVINSCNFSKNSSTNHTSRSKMRISRSQHSGR